MQDEFRWSDALTLLAGVRYDSSPFGESTNPRIGLVWQPSAATTLKLLYGTAFRPPSLFENDTTAFILGQKSDAVDILGTGLRSETIETFQLGLDHYLTPDTRLAVALYGYRLDDLLGQGFDPENSDTYFFNFSKVTGTGLEAAVERRFANGLRGRISYSLQNSELMDGSRLPNSPRHLLKLYLSTPLWRERWRLGLETIALSERFTQAGSVDEGYVLSNLVLSGDLSEKTTVSLGFYNIGNTHYADPVNPIFGADIGQEGFNFQFKFSTGF